MSYYYVIQQHDLMGESADSEEVFETPQAAPVVPDAPERLRARVRKSRVSLEWDESCLATHYTVWRATSPDGPFEPLYRLVRGDEYDDRAIEPETTYYYQVSAHNSFGESARGGMAEAEVRDVDRTPPSVTVEGVSDGGVYTLGDVPRRAIPGERRQRRRGQGRRPDRAGQRRGAGQYTYVVQAVDQASNESIVYTTYHVRYRFADSSAGWRAGPIIRPGPGHPGGDRLTDAGTAPSRERARPSLSTACRPGRGRRPTATMATARSSCSTPGSCRRSCTP